MKELEEASIELDRAGKVSKTDKWQYNDTLNILARNALFTKDTPNFGYWVSRFVTALKIVNVKFLPLKKVLTEADIYFREKCFYEKVDVYSKDNWTWEDPYKRAIMCDKWQQNYWESLFDYALELATQAGFTINLESIDESIAIRG